jgi:hypothetical protein
VLSPRVAARLCCSSTNRLELITDKGGGSGPQNQDTRPAEREVSHQSREQQTG